MAAMRLQNNYESWLLFLCQCYFYCIYICSYIHTEIASAKNVDSTKNISYFTNFYELTLSSIKTVLIYPTPIDIVIGSTFY